MKFIDLVCILICMFFKLLRVWPNSMATSLHHGPNVGAHFLPGKVTLQGNETAGKSFFPAV